MMKVLVVCLIFTSVVSAGFFTPTPEKHNTKLDDVGGVVIELENDDGSTKVSVSPKDADHHVNDEKAGGYVTNAKEKLSSKMEEAKEKIKEAATSFQANEKKDEAVGKVKDSVSDTAQKAYDKAQEMKQSVKDGASDVSSKAKEKAAEIKEGAKEKAKEKAKEAREMGRKGMKGVFRRVGDVFKYMLSPVRMASIAEVLHLLGFAVAYGTSVWVTFGSNYVLGRALSNNQLAMVQSKILPVYFKAMASSVGTALLGHLISRNRMGMLGGFNLMSSLVMILLNLFYLEPRTTKMMFERMKKEKEEGQAAAASVEPATTETSTQQQKPQEEGKSVAAAKLPTRRILLRKLNNNYSALVNVATLIPLTWHLVHLANNLHTVCT